MAAGRCSGGFGGFSQKCSGASSGYSQKCSGGSGGCFRQEAQQIASQVKNALHGFSRCPPPSGCISVTPTGMTEAQRAAEHSRQCAEQRAIRAQRLEECAAPLQDLGSKTTSLQNLGTRTASLQAQPPMSFVPDRSHPRLARDEPSFGIGSPSSPSGPSAQTGKSSLRIPQVHVSQAAITDECDIPELLFLATALDCKFFNLADYKATTAASKSIQAYQPLAHYDAVSSYERSESYSGEAIHHEALMASGDLKIVKEESFPRKWFHPDQKIMGAGIYSITEGPNNYRTINFHLSGVTPHLRETKELVLHTLLTNFAAAMKEHGAREAYFLTDAISPRLQQLLATHGKIMDNRGKSYVLRINITALLK